MVEVLVPLVMAVTGVVSLVWGVRTLAALRGEPPATGHLNPPEGPQTAELLGRARGPALGPSPLQGVACVHWNVQVIRTIGSLNGNVHRRVRRITDVDAGARPPFIIDTDGGPVTIDPTLSTVGSGHRVLHRDQASTEQTMVIDGVGYTLPPTAAGSREVAEAVVQPGQPVWVYGTAVAGPDGPRLIGTPDRVLRIHLDPHDQRRARGRTTAAGVATVGALMLLGAVAIGL